MQSLARHPFFKDVAGFDFEKFDRRVIWKKCDDGETIELQNLFDDFNMTTSSSGTFSKFAGDDSVQFLLPTLGFRCCRDVAP